MPYATLPDIVNRPIYSGRMLTLIDDTWLDSTGTAIDLSTITFVGKVYDAASLTATELATITIIADASGNFLAVIDAADAAAIVAAAIAETAYFEIYGAGAGEDPVTWYAGELYCNAFPPVA